MKEKTLKSYLECPKCGEYHEFDKSKPGERFVCLLCDTVIDTEIFEPFAITYREM